MKSKILRIGLALLSILIAVLLLYTLLHIGKKTEGPLEGFFNSVGDLISGTEHAFIMNARENKRKEKLKSFAGSYNLDVLKTTDDILLGAYDNNAIHDFEDIIDLEDALDTTFPLIHFYQAWGSEIEHQFPTARVKTIIQLGSMPVITWEPWLSAFSAEKHPELKPLDTRDVLGLEDVANGVYDFYISEWARAAKNIRSPIFLRVGHEMNDPYRYTWGPQNNTANDFVKAWKHIYDIFKGVGANNIIWIWSPHPAYGYFKAYYPGNEYVDYVGVGILNYGEAAVWSKWWSLDEILGNYYEQLSFFGKPLMLSEFGSLKVGGEREDWFADALDSLPQKYPAVKSVLFFHYSNDKTLTDKTLNWNFIDDTASVKAIKKAINKWK